MGSCEYSNESWGAMQAYEMSDKLQNYQRFKKLGSYSGRHEDSPLDVTAYGRSVATRK
jgi:hypothetical protein